MISKTTTSFLVNGSCVKFNFDAFRSEFQRYRRAENLRSTEAYRKIAETAYVSPDAVHNWYCRCNGPSTIQTVQNIAAVLDIGIEQLLEKQGEV